MCVNLDLPKTMASVLVALRSFLADDFSRFFLEALCTLYIVNLRPQRARNPHHDNEPPSQIAFHVACSVDSTTRTTTKKHRKRDFVHELGVNCVRGGKSGIQHNYYKLADYKLAWHHGSWLLALGPY